MNREVHDSRLASMKKPGIEPGFKKINWTMRWCG
ncbi:hypothetical protein J2803_004902 [Paraburkholderia phenoliruptrix]|nr:hypothetical protein [Paraburkholderia phenoliruptrix]